MHVVIEDEDSTVRTVNVREGVDHVRVGSGEDCLIYLPDLRVAEDHMRFRLDDRGVWWLEKCEIPPDSPACYTRFFVNALEVIEPRQLKHNDEILIARFRLRIYVEGVVPTVTSGAIESISKIREHPVPAGAIVHNEPFSVINFNSETISNLTDFAFDIHECQTLAELLTCSITGFMREFGALQVWMGLRRQGYGRLEFVQTLFGDGKTSGEPAHLETYQYRCVERGQSICVVHTDEPDTESAMCVPLVSTRGLLGLAYVDNKTGSAPFGPSDLDRLAVMALVITRQLELIVRDLSTYQEAVAEGELSFVRAVQAKLDPSTVPQWDGLQLAVYCKPGFSMTGDVVDVMRLPNGLASFLCGHITASPTRTALAMAEARTTFRIAGLHADPPHVLLRALNWMLHDDKNPCALCGASVILNANTGAMQFATAGNMGIVALGERGAIRVLRQPETPEVGTERDFAYASQAGRLLDGQTMVLYSPGCLAATDANDKPLGENRFLEAVSDGFGQPASAALDDLLSDLSVYLRKRRQPDDITIVWLCRQ